MSLKRTLYLIRDCCAGPQSETALLERHNLTPLEFAELLTEARDLGADIQPVRMDHSGTYWTCRNWLAINQRGLLMKWIECEESRRVA